VKPSPLSSFKIEEYVRSRLNKPLGWTGQVFDTWEDFVKENPTEKEQLEILVAPGKTFYKDDAGIIHVFDLFDPMNPVLNHKHYDTPWTEDEKYLLDKIKLYFGRNGHVMIADDKVGKTWFQYTQNALDEEEFILEIHSDELTQFVENNTRKIPYTMEGHPERVEWSYGKEFTWTPAVATGFVSKALKEHVKVAVSPDKSHVYLTFKILNIPDTWETTQEEIDKLPKELTISLSLYE
jgi:hypothetical protein